MLRHLEQDLTRLEYAARRAERQYNCVDPENRLIAATLEKKWENALAEWDHAKARLAEAAAKSPPNAMAVPRKLREAFADVGRRLPEMWPRLSTEACKQLLRTLIAQVNLRRNEDGIVQVRIVWRGDLVSETSVRLGVSRARDGGLAEGYTVREVSSKIHVDSSWIYRKIGKGRVRVSRHRCYGCYLFPRTSVAIAKLRQLKAGKLRQVSFPKEHCNG